MPRQQTQGVDNFDANFDAFVTSRFENDFDDCLVLNFDGNLYVDFDGDFNDFLMTNFDNNVDIGVDDSLAINLREAFDVSFVANSYDSFWLFVLNISDAFSPTFCGDFKLDVPY